MQAKHSARRRAGTFSVALGALLVTGILAGCGSSSSSTGGTASNGKGCKNVGVLLPESDTSARWEGKDRPLLDAAIKKALPGATVNITNANKSTDTQQSQAEADLTKGACILVVAAVDSEKASSIVDKAKASNVPVIAYDRLIQSNDLSYYVSFDNVKVGELQGQYIVDNYQKYVSSNGNNNVVMINGSETDNNAKLFNQGAMNKLKPLYDAKTLNKVYDKFTPGWDNPTAQTEMEGALTANSNKIAVAYVANDGMAGTVIAALKAQNLAGKVLVTGQDATPDGIRNILLGTQSMTVYKAIDKEANATAALVAAISNGEASPSAINGKTTTSGGKDIPSALETPVSVDKSNIASTVIADNFVTKAEVCQGVPAGTAGVC